MQQFTDSITSSAFYFQYLTGTQQTILSDADLATVIHTLEPARRMEA